MGALMHHCWKNREDLVEEVFGCDSPEYWQFVASGKRGTCMLQDGHPGPHEWTDDSEIVISLVHAEAQ
jgi:hypothetical protein